MRCSGSYEDIPIPNTSHPELTNVKMEETNEKLMNLSMAINQVAQQKQQQKMEIEKLKKDSERMQSELLECKETVQKMENRIISMEEERSTTQNEPILQENNEDLNDISNEIEMEEETIKIVTVADLQPLEEQITILQQMLSQLKADVQCIKDERNRRRNLQVIQQFVGCLEFNIYMYVLPNCSPQDYPITISCFNTMNSLEADEKERWAALKKVCPWNRPLVDTVTHYKYNIHAYPCLVRQKWHDISVQEVLDIVKKLHCNNKSVIRQFESMVHAFQLMGVAHLHDYSYL